MTGVNFKMMHIYGKNISNLNRLQVHIICSPPFKKFNNFLGASGISYSLKKLLTHNYVAITTDLYNFFTDKIYMDRTKSPRSKNITFDITNVKNNGTKINIICPKNLARNKQERLPNFKKSLKKTQLEHRLPYPCSPNIN